MRLNALGLIALGLTALPTVSKADFYIGTQLMNSGPIVTQATGASGASFSGSIGNAGIFVISASDPGSAFTATALSVPTSGSPPFFAEIYVTETGLTAPLGTPSFASTFTANVVQPGGTASEQTLISDTNAIYGGTPISTSGTFLAPSSETDVGTGSTGPGAFSETITFTFADPSPSGNRTNLDVVAAVIPEAASVPEPATASLLGLGLAAIGCLRRRRSR